MSELRHNVCWKTTKHRIYWIKKRLFKFTLNETKQTFLLFTHNNCGWSTFYKLLDRLIVLLNSFSIAIFFTWRYILGVMARCTKAHEKWFRAREALPVCEGVSLPSRLRQNTKNLSHPFHLLLIFFSTAQIWCMWVTFSSTVWIYLDHSCVKYVFFLIND